jgi:hypothetical protein
MHMIFFVLDDPDRLEAVLREWDAIGICGVTIIESTGFHRLQKKLIPARYAFWNAAAEEGHLTLLAIVPNEATVRQCLQVTEALIGNLDEPNTGVFAAWPLAFVKGVPAQGG